MDGAPTAGGGGGAVAGFLPTPRGIFLPAPRPAVHRRRCARRGDGLRRCTFGRAKCARSFATPVAILGFDKVSLSEVDTSTHHGEGSFGAVFFGRDAVSGERVVIKCPKDVPLAKGLLDTEKHVNAKLAGVSGRWSHYLGESTVPAEISLPPGTLRNCLVWRMEGDGSTLEDYLSKRPTAALGQAIGCYEASASKLRLTTFKAVMRELLAAVAELQRIGIMHRDIKPANIIVAPRSEFALRIIDFGSACDWNSFLKRGLNTATCDPTYAAPEMRISLFQPTKYDVFSVGLIGLRVLLPSFSEEWIMKDLKYRLEKCDYVLERWCEGILAQGGSSTTIAEVEELYNDDELLLVLSSMLRRQPGKRASVAGILAMPMFADVNVEI